MIGMLILDEKGFDKVAVGDPLPDPNIGKRIAPSTGIAINDDQGFERTGYGLLKVQDHYRVVLGLDSPGGQEGVSLSLLDEGSLGLTMRRADRQIDLGISPADSPVTRDQEPFHGLRLSSGGEVKYEISVMLKK